MFLKQNKNNRHTVHIINANKHYKSSAKYDTPSARMSITHGTKDPFVYPEVFMVSSRRCLERHTKHPMILLMTGSTK